MYLSAVYYRNFGFFPKIRKEPTGRENPPLNKGTGVELSYIFQVTEFTDIVDRDSKENLSHARQIFAWGSSICQT